MIECDSIDAMQAPGVMCAQTFVAAGGVGRRAALFKAALLAREKCWENLLSAPNFWFRLSYQSTTA
jgi:hypothetical protein